MYTDTQVVTDLQREEEEEKNREKKIVRVGESPSAGGTLLWAVSFAGLCGGVLVVEETVVAVCMWVGS